MVRIPVDAFGFAKSYGFDVCILDIKSESGKFSYKFLPRGEYNLSKDDKKAVAETEVVFQKVSNPKNVSLMQILADFRMAIKYPKMTASFCYRAIETIRRNFFRDNWEIFRQSIGIEESDFAEILMFGKPNRYGDYPAISYAQRERIMNFTRSIIEKLIKQI